MEDSSAILCQISGLKDMLDQVNEEMESSIQTTREMESEIVRRSEAEAALATREAELTELLYASQFELVGLAAVTAESRKSVTSTEQELRSLQKKRDEIQERMICKREEFIRRCLEFQWGIDQGEGERLQSLLAEKESLEKEIDIFTKRNHALQSSFSTSLKEMVEDLQDSGTGETRANELSNKMQTMSRRGKGMSGFQRMKELFDTRAFSGGGRFLGQRRIGNGPVSGSRSNS